VPRARCVWTGDVGSLTARLAIGAVDEDDRHMVNPGVIAGFAVIDASLIGQMVYAIRDYERHNRKDDAEH
jgi:hypothetical protein